MKLPAIFLNFKTYREATGANAVALAKSAERASSKTQIPICLVVQPTDIRAVSESVSLPVFAQHVDPVSYGANTGSILPEAVKEAGAVGTVLNHAERRQERKFLSAAVARAKDAGLEVMLCAETVARAKALAALSPNLIAYEPRELIGGSVSVSAAKPGLIADCVKSVKSVNPKIGVLAGAGIKTKSDAEAALRLGAKGVFVSSGVIKAKSPEHALLELAGAFLKR